MLQLGHISLVVRDIEKSTRFYSNILGFSVHKHKRTTRATVVHLKLDSTVLELTQYTKPEPELRPPEGVIDHIAFLVQDLKSTLEKLQRQRVEFETYGPNEAYDGSKSIFMRGPDGERIELVAILGKDL